MVASIKLWLLVALGIFINANHAYAQSTMWYFASNTVSNTVAAQPETIKIDRYITPGSHSVVVAVIDSGVIESHPALQGVLLPGFDMVSGLNNKRGGRSANYAPDERNTDCGRKLNSSAFRTHGTEVSSVIAGNGSDDMWGVNPSAKIVPIRVFGACGMALPDMSDAILWAAGLPVANLPVNNNPARIINISINGGEDTCSFSLQNAINKVIQKNVFVVVSAGNNFQHPLAEPANCQGVISVGALAADNRIENYSALDNRISIYAAGGGHQLGVNTGRYENRLRVATLELGDSGQEHPVVLDRGVGTSYSAPLVAGFISLWLSYYPEKTPADWEKELPSFIKDARTLESCLECTSLGLVAYSQFAKP